MDLYRTLDMKFNPMDSSHFENNFKRTIDCPTTWANMNEPSKRRTYRRYHCSVTYVTQQWRSYQLSWEFLIYCYMALRHSETIIPARMKAYRNFSDASVERFHSVSQKKPCDEPEWLWWGGSTL